MHLPSPDHLEQQLRSALYRFDCPSAHQLGEYALDLLIDPERRQIAEHTLECSACADELSTVRAFFTTNRKLAQLPTWRRITARLLTPTTNLQPVQQLRGDARETSSEYHAGPVHIVLGTTPARERNSVDLDGLVMHDTAPPDATRNRDVKLLLHSLAVYASRTDDLGNFAFDSVAAGIYQLEIHFADEVVVIENLRLGGARST